MQIKSSYVFLFILCCFCLPAKGESKARAEQNKVYSVEKNAQRSFSTARLTALGKFRLLGGKYQNEGFVDVGFQIEKSLIGKSPASGKLHLMLPLAKMGAKVQNGAGEPSQQDIDVVLAKQRNLETLLEQKQLTPAAYDALAQQYSLLLQRSAGYMHKYVLVKVAVGLTDEIYRSANILINFGEPMVLMMFCECREDNGIRLLGGSQFDLYPASDVRVRRAVGLK